MRDEAHRSTMSNAASVMRLGAFEARFIASRQVCKHPQDVQKSPYVLWAPPRLWGWRTLHKACDCRNLLEALLHVCLVAKSSACVCNEHEPLQKSLPTHQHTLVAGAGERGKAAGAVGAGGAAGGRREALRLCASGRGGGDAPAPRRRWCVAAAPFSSTCLSYIC